MTEADFSYTGERFADIQLLRYRLNGFEQLSLSQKQYIYCLAKAFMAVTSPSISLDATILS